MKGRPVVLALAVAAIAAAVFLPAIAGDWIYDDHPLIPENPYIHSFRWWPRWFVTDFWDLNEDLVRFGRMVYWRPGVTASYALDWQLGGGSAVLFHLSNTLYHAVVAALAFVVLRRWIGATWPAVAAALLFAIHPTKAESVAWIAGRTDLLCAIGILIAAEGIGRRLRGARHGVILEVIGTIIAYLCKEQAIVLPVFAAVEGWIAAGRPEIALRSITKIVRTALPQAAVAIAYLGLRAIIMPIEASKTAGAINSLDHLQAVLETMGRFVTLTFAPHGLSIQHGLVHRSGGDLIHSMPYVIFGAVAVVALITAAIAARRRWPVVTVGIGVYLVTLLPTSNLKYTDMQTLVSERFLYLPIFGIALIVGAALARLDQTWARRAYVFVAVCVLATGALAASRAADFSDEQRFWTREHQLHPDSREAITYQLRMAVREKRYQAALTILQTLKKLFDRYDPTTADDVRIAYELGEVLSRLIPDADAEALRAIDRFCQDMLDPATPTAVLDLRGVRIGIGQKTASYETRIELFRARFLILRADLQGRLDNDEAALVLAAQARASCATCVTVYVKDAIAHARAGRYEDAYQVLDRVADEVPADTVTAVRGILDKAQRARDAAASARGPEQLQARAYELTALELWGRAYAVLAPHKDEIMRAPRFAKGFAELAFRAGETAVAREVLAATVPAPEIEPLLQKWATTMGWVD